jgi:hypothetical protein
MEGPDMDKDMSTTDKALAWVGLVFGGGLSIAGNLRAAYLPSLGSTDVDVWRKLPQQDPSSTSVVAAVAVPFAAVLLVEMLKRWTFLPVVIRRGAIGLTAFIAAAASWVHLFMVMLHEGNHPVIAAAVPLIPDTIAIVSAMALLSRTDKPAGPSVLDTMMDAGRFAVDTDNIADNIADNMAGLPIADTDMDTTPGADSFAPDTVDTDTLHALVPATRDMDTTDTEPDTVTVPAPRRTARTTDTGWKVLASEALSLGYGAGEIAARILQDDPDVWPTYEAGRKAVSRLR